MSEKSRQQAEVLHVLDAKVRVMAELLNEAGKLPKPSRRVLAQMAGIPYDTLKAAWAAGAATPDVQQKLAALVGFDVSDSRWCDRDVPPAGRSAMPKDYGGRDSEANFRVMLRKLLGLGADYQSRIKGEKPAFADVNLATFSVDDAGQSVTAGEPSAIFVQIVMQPGYFDNEVIFGFSKARLRLQFDKTSKAKVQKRLGDGADVEIGNAHITSIGKEYDAYWSVASNVGPLDGHFVTSENPLCQVEELKLNEVFWAELAVRPADGSLILPQSMHDIGNTKSLIIRTLISQSVSEADTQGWITLGRQRLIYVKADQA